MGAIRGRVWPGAGIIADTAKGLWAGGMLVRFNGRGITCSVGVGYTSLSFGRHQRWRLLLVCTAGPTGGQKNPKLLHVVLFRSMDLSYLEGSC